MGDIQIIPTILTDDVTVAKRQMVLVEDIVQRVQIDIIDGVFVKNKTIQIEDIGKVTSQCLIDVHLMVDNPASFLHRLDGVGVDRVYAQVEKMPDQLAFVDQASSLGIQIGLAVDLYTPVAAIAEVLPQLDGVLLMSVEAGFQGQKFQESVLKKIAELRKQFERDICMDGGMNVETVPLCLEQGANHFGVGSALWKSKDISDKLEELRSAL